MQDDRTELRTNDDHTCDMSQLKVQPIIAQIHVQHQHRVRMRTRTHTHTQRTYWSCPLFLLFIYFYLQVCQTSKRTADRTLLGMLLKMYERMASAASEEVIYSGCREDNELDNGLTVSLFCFFVFFVLLFPYFSLYPTFFPSDFDTFLYILYYTALAVIE